jgi:hypothetical protein
MTAWTGIVEEFDIKGCPTASKCYGWGITGNDGKTEFVTVLGASGIDSASKAVQAHIISKHGQ